MIWFEIIHRKHVTSFTEAHRGFLHWESICDTSEAEASGKE